jgi:YfiR/HmsC-like
MAFLTGFAPATDWRGRRCQSAAFVVLLAWLLGSSSALFGQGGPSPEYQIKAVFLFNLAQFVEWPSRAFSDATAPLIIGVLGDDPFGGYLDETLRGERVNKRPLVAQRYRRVSDIKTCHVLFISRSESDRLEQIFATLRGRITLTVGDTDDFITRGGMIRLVTERSKIRIRINLNTVKAANLTISSKLLRLAQPEP